MHEIEVFVLKDGADGDPYIKVQPDLIGVHSGDDVFWHIHSLVREVRWVEIEFEGPRRASSKFFECRDDEYPESKCYAKLQWGHGHLLGTAPELNKKGRGTARAKYFVRGYRNKPNGAEQEPMVELDPDIIVCDP